jgi:hypothetical protein
MQAYNKSRQRSYNTLKNPTGKLPSPRVPANYKGKAKITSELTKS